MDETQRPEPGSPTPPPPESGAAPPPHSSAATSSSMSEKDARQWAMLTHISALIGIFTGIGFLLGPLIMWIIKKDESAFVDAHGKEAVNFQITMMIAALISSVLMIVLIGFVLILIVALMAIILPIVAGLKANEGEYYRYPATIRIIK